MASKATLTIKDNRLGVTVTIDADSEEVALKTFRAIVKSLRKMKEEKKK